MLRNQITSNMILNEMSASIDRQSSESVNETKC